MRGVGIYRLILPLIMYDPFLISSTDSLYPFSLLLSLSDSIGFLYFSSGIVALFSSNRRLFHTHPSINVCFVF